MTNRSAKSVAPIFSRSRPLGRFGGTPGVARLISYPGGYYDVRLSARERPGLPRLRTSGRRHNSNQVLRIAFTVGVADNAAAFGRMPISFPRGHSPGPLSLLPVVRFPAVRKTSEARKVYRPRVRARETYFGPWIIWGSKRSTPDNLPSLGSRLERFQYRLASWLYVANYAREYLA